MDFIDAYTVVSRYMPYRIYACFFASLFVRIATFGYLICGK
ncbi:hypothetical protein HMPREF2533_00734 [Bacteroides fragilis]|nr:putative membrane protein [Bacteroides fragilis str. 1009-4-F \